MSTRSETSNFGYKPVYSSSLGSGGTGSLTTLTTLTTPGPGYLDATLTAAQALGGLVFHMRGTLTTPTAADLVAAMPGCMVGTAFDLNVRHTGDEGDFISVLEAAAGITISGSRYTQGASCKTFRFVVTDNRVGSETITAYVVSTGTGLTWEPEEP